MLPRLHVQDIFNAAVQAVQPATVLPAYLQLKNGLLVVNGEKYAPKNAGKFFAVATGKAALGMMGETHKILGDAIEKSLVITKKAHEINIRNCMVIEADHPVPGKRSVAAAHALIQFLKNINSSDIILFLISGGTSALVTDVPATLTLNDIQLTQKLLLLCGAGINEVNCVRKHLSGIKGGRLIKYCNGATIFSFIISDVAGNDVSVIGSGLTARDNSSVEDAIRVIQKYQLIKKLPLPVSNYLRHKAGTAAFNTSNNLFNNVKNMVVADNKMALQNAAVKASSLGYHVAALNTGMFGNTEEEATGLVNKIKNYKGRRPACFIAGGETTLEVKGKGEGGRNQHFALTMLQQLIKGPGNNYPFPVILAAGTDGTDGTTDAAGAIIDAAIAKQVIEENTGVKEYLSDNDSYNFFKRMGGLFITGPTETNVMDIIIALIE